jgi:hypothetical protein
MTVPSFSDWAKMYMRANARVQCDCDTCERYRALSYYILSRIRRKEEAWNEELLNQSKLIIAQDLMQKLTISVYRPTIVETLKFDVVPYPPNSQSALTEIRQKEE